MALDTDDLTEALRQNLKLRDELAAEVAKTKAAASLRRPWTTVRAWMVFLTAFVLIYAAYWYVYGRERDLPGTELEKVDKDIARYLRASNTDEHESKRLSDLWTRRSAILSAALSGRLTLTPHGTGSTVDGSFVSNRQNWVTNRIYVHVRILEKKHCGEKLHNIFSDIEWDEKCAADPTHSVTDVVDGQNYRCFVGSVEFGETARCRAETVLPFDPSKQSWDFFVTKVMGRPIDPLNIF